MLHMAQKDYNLEIVRLLLKNKSHIRDIANKLNINHMMIVRKMNTLTEGNVVDFKQEGKNKVYFIKKTVEARMYVLIAEHYALIQTIKKYPGLRNIIGKIQKNKKINLAIIFGSYAKWNAKKESDIDIFVETTSKNIKKEIGFLDSRINVKIGKYNQNNLLIKEIEKNHLILKGADIYYEKNTFFN